MGLDGVELVMAVEEEFKIAISDSEAAECITVGKLVDLVHSRLRHGAQEPCASQHGFYIARRHLMDTLGLPRNQIKPETRLDALIGRANRQTHWRNLCVALGKEAKRWPPLVRPTWLNVVLFSLCVVTCLSLALTSLPFVISFFVAIAVVLLGVILTIPLKNEFSTRFSRVQDLVQFITTLDAGVWSKEEVFQKIRAITVEQLGVKESQVTLEAKFVDDLGCE